MSKSFDDIYRGLNYDLIKHYEQGVSDERERIIKLLQQELASGFAKAFVIGLINGETK